MRKSFLGALAAFGLLGAAGCASFSSGSLVPNTNFAYPNSNVTPIGPATGSAGGVCSVLGFSTKDGTEDLSAALKQALSKSGGDLIIDGKVSSTTTNIAVIGVCNTTVTGTAAKMEIGKQQLR